MSKAKSRQSSRQGATTGKNGSGGSARTATVSGKPTTSALDDAAENIENDASTATPATDDTVEAAETDAAPSTAAKASADRTATASTTTPAKSGKTGTVASATAKGASTKPVAKSVPNTPALKAVPSTPIVATGKAQSRDAAKYERRQADRQMRYLAERRRRRNRILTGFSIFLAIVVVAAGVTYFVYQSRQPQHAASQGTYQEAIYNSSYPPVDSVYCDQLEQSIEHIHVYVTMYINGTASPLPAGVGIPQDSSGNVTCYYWLHTHDSTGVIHIESPSSEVFTFGQFRDEWDQQFQSLGFPNELLLSGWKIWINGKVYNGSLTSVPLDAHNIITLAYNSPNVKPATTYAWNGL